MIYIFLLLSGFTPIHNAPIDTIYHHECVVEDKIILNYKRTREYAYK